MKKSPLIAYSCYVLILFNPIYEICLPYGISSLFILQLIFISLAIWTILTFGQNVRKHPFRWGMGLILFIGFSVEVIAFGVSDLLQ